VVVLVVVVLVVVAAGPAALAERWRRRVAVAAPYAHHQQTTVDRIAQVAAGGVTSGRYCVRRKPWPNGSSCTWIGAVRSKPS
jgi:hypothetical protein